jgi:hypothetical protein
MDSAETYFKMLEEKQADRLYFEAL